MPLISTLRYYRKKQRITTTKMSIDLSIPVNTIKAWEKLYRNIEFIDALKLASYLDIPSNDIIGKQSIQIPQSEYHELYRPRSVYVPHEVRLQDKHRKLIDDFLYKKRVKAHPFCQNNSDKEN